MAQHRKSSIEKWQRIISNAESSNLSSIEFCNTHGFSSKSFYAWKSKLRNLGSGSITLVKRKAARRQAVKNWASIVEDFNYSGVCSSF